MACQVEWYKTFQLVICGLDNVEARRWINDLVQYTAVVAGLRLTVRVGQLLSFVKFDDQGKPEMETVCDMLQQGGTLSVLCR